MHFIYFIPVFGNYFSLEFFLSKYDMIWKLSLWFFQRIEIRVYSILSPNLRLISALIKEIYYRTEKKLETQTHKLKLILFLYIWSVCVKFSIYYSNAYTKGVSNISIKVKGCYSRFYFHVLDHCQWLRMPSDLSARECLINKLNYGVLRQFPTTSGHIKSKQQTFTLITIWKFFCINTLWLSVLKRKDQCWIMIFISFCDILHFYDDQFLNVYIWW